MFILFGPSRMSKDYLRAAVITREFETQARSRPVVVCLSHLQFKKGIWRTLSNECAPIISWSKTKVVFFTFARRALAGLCPPTAKTCGRGDRGKDLRRGTLDGEIVTDVS